MNTDNQAGVTLIAQERKRQIEVEKWDLSHDADYSQGELIGAAGCYAANALSKHLEDYRHTNQSPLAKFQVYYNDKKVGWGDGWPWDKKWDKRKKHDKLRSLVIAGALIAAEIDRLNPPIPSPHPSAEAVSEVWDKVNKRVVTSGVFLDLEGNVWKDQDPHGVDMSGKRKIALSDQYEVRPAHPSPDAGQDLEEKAKEIPAESWKNLVHEAATHAHLIEAEGEGSWNVVFDAYCEGAKHAFLAGANYILKQQKGE